MPAYSASHYHRFPPVMTLTLQDPTPQKHPRLDSADMGVGMYVLGMIFESARRITTYFSWKLAIGFK